MVFTAVRATAGAILYSNRTYGVVYKFTVYLHKIRHKRRPLIPTVSYQFEIKVAATPPTPPLDNINNYKYILYNSSVAGKKKTPYNSIFLAVNPFDKARYKFHRRGLFECGSPAFGEHTSSAVCVNLSKL